MPDTRVTKARLKNFFFYSKWLFVAVIAIVFVVTDLLYTTTRYRSPDEREVSFQIVTSYVDTETGLMDVAAKALEAGKVFDPTLEEVTFSCIGYNPDDSTDTYGYQKYYVMVGSGEGDIYMLPKSLMKSLASQGYLVPLEGYIDEGILDPGDVDLADCTFHENPEDEGYDPEATHIYAVPCDNLNAMLEENIGMNNHGFYFVIMAFSANPDTSAFVMGNVVEQLTAPEPEWYTEAMAASTENAEEGTNVFDEALGSAGY